MKINPVWTLTEIVLKTTQVPCMSREVEEAFRLRPEMEAYRVSLNALIMDIRNEAQTAIDAAYEPGTTRP